MRAGDKMQMRRIGHLASRLANVQFSEFSLIAGFQSPLKAEHDTGAFCPYRKRNGVSDRVYMHLQWPSYCHLSPLSSAGLDTSLAMNSGGKLLNHASAFCKTLMNESHERKNPAWPESREGLSIARGALHPHLLAHGWRRKKMANQAAQPLSLLCFLCGRFSVGSNESRQQLFACSVAAPW